MSQPTEHTAPPQPVELADLIAEALAATGVLPTIGRCEELRDALVRGMRPLIDETRRKQGYEPAGTATWQRCEAALLQAQGALCGGMGLGLRSAALHVATLAEAARALDGCIRSAP
ncbi:DUF6415 family natural product biosynthesis protein [Streptomyces sp. NPDC093272]|uniref:DUF6415 family natural product biosynthesis protein n=1 Tax=unclassified Streptomyces TaxID=2593676 RepID=UPI0034300145